MPRRVSTKPLERSGKADRRPRARRPARGDVARVASISMPLGSGSRMNEAISAPCAERATPGNHPRPRRTLVLTGNGRGKTTSAAGLCLRALARGRTVLVVQFVKNRPSGEMEMLAALGARIERTGLGFLPPSNDPRHLVHRGAAREGMLLAAAAIGSGAWDMVVLDEIGIALDRGLVALEDVMALVNAHSGVLVLTGRGIPPLLESVADTVTRLECVRHAFEDGCAAQEGVEW